MAHPNVIAIHGRAGAGKGVIAGHLVERHGYTVVKVAAPIKAMLRAALLYGAGLCGEDIDRCIEGDLKEVPVPRLGGHTPRYAMQILGSEFQNAVCPGMFARMAAQATRRVVQAGRRAVVDDLRFPVEVGHLREQGASFWRVDRPVAHDAPSNGRASRPTPWDPVEPTSVPDQDVVFHMVWALLLSSGLDEKDALERLAGYRGNEPWGFIGKSANVCHYALSAIWLERLRQTTPVSMNATEDGQPIPSYEEWLLRTEHVSERGLTADTFDVVLVNRGTEHDLYCEVERALQRHPMPYFGIAERRAA
jgi:hypothetical protein